MTKPEGPAGAREHEYPPEVKSILDRCEANVVSFSTDDVSTLLVEIDQLAQQTAAKDAEIARLRATMAKDDALLGKVAKSREAAERERDSLREANARLAADLDAALKAAKDGQK